MGYLKLRPTAKNQRRRHIGAKPTSDSNTAINARDLELLARITDGCGTGSGSVLPATQVGADDRLTSLTMKLDTVPAVPGVD